MYLSQVLEAINFYYNSSTHPPQHIRAASGVNESCIGIRDDVRQHLEKTQSNILSFWRISAGKQNS